LSCARANYVSVQVLTPAGVLDRDKQLGVVSELTEIVAAQARDATLADWCSRLWVARSMRGCRSGRRRRTGEWTINADLVRDLVP
jgi:hypothetical protein